MTGAYQDRWNTEGKGRFWGWGLSSVYPFPLRLALELRVVLSSPYREPRGGAQAKASFYMLDVSIVITQQAEGNEAIQNQQENTKP